MANYRRKRYYTLNPLYLVVGKITVYVCQEPSHEELVSILKNVIDNIKGKKPKIKVVRLKLKRAEDFPYYLRTLEELYGGIATAEFRKYGIQSLPAIVYNGRAILQGKVPTREEIEEALAFEGLKVVRGALAVQPVPQPTTQVAQPKRAADVPRIELRIRDSLPSRHAPERSAEPLKPAERALTPAVAQKTEQPLAKPAAQSPGEGPPEKARLGPERSPLQPTPSLRRAVLVAHPPPVEVEEVSLEGRAEAAKAAQARPSAGRKCDGCIFYERNSRRCLLYRVAVTDPLNPPCARRP